MPGRTWMCRAYQAVVVPQSTASITSSGSRSLRVWKSSCGLTGSAGCSARSRCARRHAEVASAISARQAVGPGPGPSSSSSARRVGRGVAGQVHLGRVPQPQLGAVQVDLHRAGLPGRRIELRVRHVAADDQQPVAAAHQLPAGSGAEQADRAGHPRFAVVDGGEAEQRRGHPGAEPVGDLAYLVARAQRALPDEHRHPLARRAAPRRPGAPPPPAARSACCSARCWCGSSRARAAVPAPPARPAGPGAGPGR